MVNSRNALQAGSKEGVHPLRGGGSTFFPPFERTTQYRILVVLVNAVVGVKVFNIQPEIVHTPAMLSCVIEVTSLIQTSIIGSCSTGMNMVHPSRWATERRHVWPMVPAWRFHLFHLCHNTSGACIWNQHCLFQFTGVRTWCFIKNENEIWLWMAVVRLMFKYLKVALHLLRLGKLVTSSPV